jgi:hypothetical protein
MRSKTSKVADEIIRLVRQLDKPCVPLDMTPADANVVDWRASSNFFTMDAITDIGLNAPLGFLD